MTESSPTGLSTGPAQVLTRKIPKWLLAAPTALHEKLRAQGMRAHPWPDKPAAAVKALQQAHVHYRINEQRLAPILAQLPTAEAFAEPILTAAIKTHFDLDVNVREAYLFKAHRAELPMSFIELSHDPLVRLQKCLKAATQSLLEAALQNFEASEAEPGGMDIGAGQASAIYGSYPLKGVSIDGTLLSIPPWAFAWLCRELDLGGQYQRLIESVLNPPDTPEQGPGIGAANRRSLFKLLEHSVFEVQVHRAYLNDLIDERLRDAALDIARGRPATLDGAPLSCTFLQLWEVELIGIVVIGKDYVDSRGIEPIMVYVPDDPVAPLKLYASSQAFHNELRDRMLKTPRYMSFFQRFVPARQRAMVYRRLREVLEPKVWNDTDRIYEIGIGHDARLHLREGELKGSFLSALSAQKFAQLKDDALFHAVPTAEVSFRTMVAKLEYLAGLAFNALNIAAFVVPGLGEVMLGVMAAQLSYEAYEGVESLAHDEKAQAWGYLMDIVQNLALIGALGTATAGLGKIPAIEMPALVGRMREVQLPDGSSRLWKPDLEPFAHDIVLPAGLKPNAVGLYEYQDKLWLPLEGRIYAVRAGADGKAHRLQHPARDGGYQPLLRHNGSGAWLHELDQPLEWQGLKLFRRLGRLGSELSDEAVSQALQVSGTHEATLRRILAENEPPPGLLVDTVQRFEIDQDLQRFIAQMEAGDASADSQLQASLLHDQPGWPVDRSVVPGAGDVLVDALNMLDEPAIKVLLDEEPGAGRIAQDVRVRRLRGRLAQAARDGRSELFAWRYARLQVREAAEVGVFQGVFGGLPSAVIDEVLAHASEEELAQLRAEQRVPLRLGQEARAFLHQVRLSRVYEGLYLDSVSSVDTPRLFLHSVERLPGWADALRIEVRDGHFNGPLLDSIGPLDAPARKVLVQQGDGYLALDEEGGHLHGRDDFLSALMHALPDEQRAALGVPHVGQSVELRQKLQASPLLPRQSLMEALQMQRTTPGRRSPMRLADGRLGYPLSGGMAGYITEESLLDKIRLLEFDDVFAEDVLRQMNDAGLSRAQINERLNQLLDEQQALRTVLDNWTAAASHQPSMSLPRQVGRASLGEALWQLWRASALPEIGRGAGELVLQSFYIDDFPSELPSFVGERATSLTLVDTQVSDWSVVRFFQPLDRVLTHFPNLTSLTALNFSGDFMLFSRLSSTVAECLPQLESLVLRGPGVMIGDRELTEFRRMPRLRRLDLGNTAMFQQEPDFTVLSLDYLGLDGTMRSRWPSSLTAQGLASIAEVSLAQNSINSLPKFLLRAGVDEGPRTHIRLNGNPLGQRTIIRARLSEWSGSRYSFDMDVPVELQPHLHQLEVERGQFLQALDDWSQASTSTGQANPARAQTALEIRRFWHRTAYAEHGTAVLRLDEQAIADFPQLLPDAFYLRVRNLQVTGTADNAVQLNQLLPRFAQLRNVRFIGEGMLPNALPTALERLGSLGTLDLSGMSQEIDQAAMEAFGRLSRLRWLDLDGNFMGEITDVSALASLKLSMLSMQRVGLTAWPTWLEQLVPHSLDSLYLNGNQIVDLPQWVLDNPRSTEAVTIIDLRGNPLSRETMTEAHLSEARNRSFEFSMDLPEDIAQLRRHRHASDSSDGNESNADPDSGAEDADIVQPALPHEGWLNGSIEEVEQRQALWGQLVNGNDASQLLSLIDRLRYTGDYRSARSRPELIERVWRVLEVAGQDGALRLTLNGMAEEPLAQFRAHDTCPDGLRLEFNQMEVQVFIRQSLLEVANEQRGSALLRLTRRLYRLNELDSTARARAGVRDEAEVRLAYRLRWAEALDLPLPPRRMLYEDVANVSQLELEEALQQVQHGEGGSEFLDYAVHRDFWVNYLREAYAERFRVLKGYFEAQVQALLDRYPDETTEQLGVRIKALEEQLKADELNLLRELTVQEGQLA
ncbi:hypothetical protein DCO48_10795 [Pseudomonas sp. SDI]|uniref:NEL-type E3 ubiquitin ligase domain-containing protein n=1 Tax=Pseudomonas sp. SDI TaxID=2170734 RepID=UPI000DE621A8|nr:NEL-type E3 ubiquitin ligase domain-containing protein [Pseudomonas sp. SDI]PWB33144.1 hypothetical protein DCO48_10795 [Pseudomonas sp. SDI]